MESERLRMRTELLIFLFERVCHILVLLQALITFEPSPYLRERRQVYRNADGQLFQVRR